MYIGRQVVTPTSEIGFPVASAMTARALTSSSLPWVGPMVTVVYRLASSAESSSEKSTMPCVEERNSEGCAGCGSGATDEAPLPSACSAAARPAAVPWSAICSGVPSPVIPPAATTEGPVCPPGRKRAASGT